MTLVDSRYPGSTLEDMGAGQMRTLARAEPRASPEGRPALLEFLQSEVESEWRMLSVLLRLEEARIAPGRLAERDAFDEARLRLVRSARIQDSFARHAGVCRVAFAGYLRQVCADLSKTFAAPAGHVLTCETSKVQLPAPSAIGLGVVAGEMIILAFKHGFTGRHGGRVHVAFSVTAAAWELVVEDTGSVTQEAYGPRVAGLAMARTVIDRLGGQLDVATVIGGNRLTVTLPRS